MPRNKANDGLGEMDVEVVADGQPRCTLLGARLSSSAPRLWKRTSEATPVAFDEVFRSRTVSDTFSRTRNTPQPQLPGRRRSSGPPHASHPGLDKEHAI
jgi:hypothetical protein